MRNRRNYNRNHFFCLRFVFTIFYTASFQVPPEKNHPYLKSQFPPKIPIWPKSLLHKRSEKWVSPPSPPSPRRGGGIQTMPSSWDTVNIRGPWPDWPHPFLTNANPKKFLSTCKKSVYSISLILWPDWPHLFLTMFTSKIFNHLLICVN